MSDTYLTVRDYKFHEDRTFRETVSFNELQILARKSKEACEESCGQEEEH